MAFRGEAMAAGFDGSERTAAARAGARRISIAPPPDRAEAFADAKRRSARVRFLRKAILISVVVAILAMLGVVIFDPFSPKFGPLSFSALSIDGTKITMARPKLAGFRSDGQPYTLTAERALQDVKQPTIVELETLNGDIGMAGGEPTHITADTGVYDSVSQHMRLSKNIRIGNDRFEVRLRSADIDFKSGAYRSDESVEVHVGDGTTILGDRASARNNGQELVFEGHVKTTIRPQDDAAPDAAPKRGNP